MHEASLPELQFQVMPANPSFGLSSVTLVGEEDIAVFELDPPVLWALDESMLIEMIRAAMAIFDGVVVFMFEFILLK